MSRPRFWLLFMDKGGVAERLAARLEARGDRCLRIREEMRDATRLADQVASALSSDVDGFAVYLGGLDRGSSPDAVARDAQARTLEVVTFLKSLSLATPAPKRTFLVSRGSVVTSNEEVDPAAAATWGVARTAMAELRSLGCTCVDLDRGGAPDDDARLLEQELVASDGETQVAYRGGVRFVSRLTRSASDEAPPKKLSGTYVVSGGFGALGLAVAGRLASRGVERLVLLGRRGARKEIEPEIEELKKRVEVVSGAVDVSDERALAELLARVRASGPPLRGVIHAAGVLDDGILLNQDEARIGRVFSPKVHGAWNLHMLTAGDSLENFVLFSSVAGVLGNAGQANYAAANTFLDALAHLRHARGLPALSIDWGGWEGDGMAAHIATPIDLLPVDVALDAFDTAMAGKAVQVSVFAPNWQRLLDQLGDKKAPTFLEHVLEGLARPKAPVQKSELGKELSALPPASRKERILSLLRDELCVILRAEPGSIAPSSQFRELGMDSLAGLAFSQRLQTAFPEIGFVPTLIYEIPSVGGVADDLVAKLGVTTEAPRNEAPIPAPSLLDELSDQEVERRLAEKMRVLQ